MIDIKVARNIIGGRQGWAYICNSGKFAVLKSDRTVKQECEDYQTWESAGVRIAWNYRNIEHYDDAYLAWSKEIGGYEFVGGGAMIKSDFGMNDVIKMVNRANNPVVRENDIVAIAVIDEKSAYLALYRVKDINIHCYTKAVLKPLTDADMMEIKKNAKAWCNS